MKKSKSEQQHKKKSVWTLSFCDFVDILTERWEAYGISDTTKLKANRNCSTVKLKPENDFGIYYQCN